MYPIVRRLLQGDEKRQEVKHLNATQVHDRHAVCSIDGLKPDIVRYQDGLIVSIVECKHGARYKMDNPEALRQVIKYGSELLSKTQRNLAQIPMAFLNHTQIRCIAAFNASTGRPTFQVFIMFCSLKLIYH